MMLALRASATTYCNLKQQKESVVKVVVFWTNIFSVLPYPCILRITDFEVVPHQPAAIGQPT